MLMSHTSRVACSWTDSGIIHTSKFLVIICSVTWKTASKMVGTSLAMRSFSLLMMAANRLNTSASLQMCTRRNVRGSCLSRNVPGGMLREKRCRKNVAGGRLQEHCQGNWQEECCRRNVPEGMLQEEQFRSSVRGICLRTNVPGVLSQEARQGAVLQENVKYTCPRQLLGMRREQARNDRI